MKYRILLNILDAGSGDDSTIGMVGGSLKWINEADASYSQFSAGFIDHKSFSDIASSCNISQGGAFGGFQGIVSINCISFEVVNAIIAETISPIGKEIRIYLASDAGTGYNLSQRYIGVITSWHCPDEATTVFSCDTSTAFDRKKIQSISITKEMALNIEGNEAIGKNIEDVYGETCDFPLIYVPAEKQITSAALESIVYDDSLTDVITSIYNFEQANQGFLFPRTDSSGVFRGYNEMVVLGKYQDNENSNVWIALSMSGTELFVGSTVDSYIEVIKKELLGRRVRFTRGANSGNSNKIIAIKATTHTIQDGYDLYTAWFQLDTADIDSIESSGYYDASTESDDQEIHQYELADRQFIIDGSFVDPRYRVPYDNGTPRQNISHLVFVGFPNIFLLSASCDATSGILIGYDESNGEKKQVAIPSNGISVLQKSDKWQMIKIDLPVSVNNEGGSVSVVSNERIDDAYYRVPLPSPYDNNYNSIASGVSEKDSVSDMEVISASGNSHSMFFTGTLGRTCTHTNSIIIPVNKLWNNESNLSSEDFKTFIVPKLKYQAEWDSVGALGTSIILQIRVAAFNEGGIFMGDAYSETLWVFENQLADQVISIEVDPVNKVCNFSGTIKGFNQTADESAYAAIEKALDCSEMLKTDTLRFISDISVFVRCVITSSNSEGSSNSGTAYKEFYRPYIGFSRNVGKNNLFLRASRSNSGYDLSTPIGIIRKIAYDSGLDTDYTSFNEVDAIQSNLLTSSMHDCQIKMDASKSISDIIDDICKMTMTAVYQRNDGTFYSTWFADDDKDTPTDWEFPNYAIIKGSVSISKPQSAYLSTDFSFGLKKSHVDDGLNLFVNTDNDISVFPSQGSRDQYGEAITTDAGYTITAFAFGYSVSLGTGYKCLKIRKSGYKSSILDRFVVGTSWQLSDGTGAGTVFCRVVAVAPDYAYGDGYSGAKVAFQYDDFIVPDPWTVTSITPYAPQDSWKDLVSGSFVSDYTTASNIWEHANNARIKIGVEKKMNSQYTTLSAPIWGTDDDAIMQWILYTVLHNTREKTVIRFSCKTNLASDLKLMGYIKFQWGPYGTSGQFNGGTYGRIVEIVDNLETCTTTITLLTSISDTDAVIIDEQLASSEYIDENSGLGDIYNEGSLA